MKFTKSAATTKLQELQAQLEKDPSCKRIRCPVLRLNIRKERAKPKVMKMLKNYVNAIRCVPSRDEDGIKSRIEFGKISVLNRKKWVNSFSQERGVHIPSVKDHKPVMRTIKTATLLRHVAIASRMAKTIASQESCTVRHTHYLEKDRLRSQMDTRNIIHDIAATFRVPRFYFSSYGSSAGSICGNIVYRTRHDQHDYENKNGLMTMPMKSPAKFVLIIETHATANALVRYRLQDKLNYILIASRGFGDGNTRQMVYLLWHYLAIPILVMTDGDPSGMEIMCNYRFGSLSMAYGSDSMVCPAVRWMGIFPHQVSKFGLQDEVKPLTESDNKKISELENRPYIKQNPDLTQCLDHMRRLKGTIQLEALTLHERDGVKLLADEVIPHVLRHGHWV